MSRETKKFVLVIMLVVLMVAIYGSLQYSIHDLGKGAYSAQDNRKVGWNLDHPVGHAGYQREQLYKFAVVAVPVCIFVLCFMRLLSVWDSPEQQADSRERIKRSVEEQLRQLDSMYRNQRISDDEYQQKRAELLLRL